MQKRVLFLPIIWGAYGLAEVVMLNYLFGPILNNLPYIPNDKPIGGSYLPATFFNVVALLLMLGLSLWATGFLTIDWNNPRTKREIGALAILCGSGFMVFYAPIFVAPLVVSLLYLLATNIE